MVTGAGSNYTPYISSGQISFSTSNGQLNVTSVKSLYADLAEAYASDAEYAPGTVLEFGGEFDVTISTTNLSTKIAGIVSTDPSYLMNGDLDSANVAIVALQGRIPTTIVGPVGKGDMLVSAGNGMVTVCNTPLPGSVLGKSLTNFTATEEQPTSTIEIAIGRT
jgi:hypothetical protein